MLSLVTYFRGWKPQAIDAGDLQAWRAEYFIQEDVFHPELLQGIILADAYPRV